jgi:hypothetical protein
MESSTIAPAPPPTPAAAPPSPEPERRRAAVRASWRALWTSRLLVLGAGIYGIMSIDPPTGAVLPNSLAPFGHLGNLLVGPSARWDSGWYVAIAQHPYTAPAQAAFFPLYPLTMKAVGAVIPSLLVSGIVVSLAAFAAALYFLYRLAALEVGEERAELAVLALAFFPTAFFLSAVYAESLLLVLMIGSVYAGRTGRWWLAGILGGLASATHNSGILVLVPLVLLYLYGPRADRAQPQPDTHGSRWRPRHPVRADILWLALIPVGLLIFFAAIGSAFGDWKLPLNANDVYWHRHFAPFAGFTQGLVAAADAIAWVAGPAHGTLYTVHRGSYELAGWELTDIVFLIGAVIATIGVLRRLPFAYGAYCLAALAVGTSAPRNNEPLVSFPRYALVLFPAALWLSLWASDRRRAALAIGVFAFGLGVFTIQFSTWRWVA